MKTKKQHYRVDRKEIGFLKFIFEAYNGIAVLTTADPKRGIITIYIAPGCEEKVAYILRDLKKDIMIEPVTSP